MTKKQKTPKEPEFLDATEPLPPQQQAGTASPEAPAAQAPSAPPAEVAELPLTTRIGSTPAGETALFIKGGPFGPEEKWLAWKPLEGYRVAFLILGQSAQLLGQSAQLLGQPAPLE